MGVGRRGCALLPRASRRACISFTHALFTKLAHRCVKSRIGRTARTELVHDKRKARTPILLRKHGACTRAHTYDLRRGDEHGRCVRSAKTAVVFQNKKRLLCCTVLYCRCVRCGIVLKELNESTHLLPRDSQSQKREVLAKLGVGRPVLSGRLVETKQIQNAHPVRPVNQKAGGGGGVNVCLMFEPNKKGCLPSPTRPDAPQQEVRKFHPSFPNDDDAQTVHETQRNSGRDVQGNFFTLGLPPFNSNRNMYEARVCVPKMTPLWVNPERLAQASQVKRTRMFGCPNVPIESH